MFNATNCYGTRKYRVMIINSEISFSAEGHSYTKKLSVNEKKFLDDYEFMIVNDAECTCLHKLLCEADCTCDREGFSVYVCTMNSAVVIRGFKYKGYTERTAVEGVDFLVYTSD